MSESHERAIRFGAMLPTALRQWQRWHPRAVAVVTWSVLDRLENGFHAPTVAILYALVDDDGWTLLASVPLSAEAEPGWWQMLADDVARAITSATRYLAAVEAEQRKATTRQTRTRA